MQSCIDNPDLITDVSKGKFPSIENWDQFATGDEGWGGVFHDKGTKGVGLNPGKFKPNQDQPKLALLNSVCMNIMREAGKGDEGTGISWQTSVATSLSTLANRVGPPPTPNSNLDPNLNGNANPGSNSDLNQDPGMNNESPQILALRKQSKVMTARYKDMLGSGLKEDDDSVKFQKLAIDKVVNKLIELELEALDL